MYYNELSREYAEKLQNRLNADGIDSVEIIRRLLLLNRLTEPYVQRLASDGSGRIRAVDVDNTGFIVKTWDGDELQYREHRRGWRWFVNNTLISRNDAELKLGVWPGYIDALEDVYGFIRDALVDAEIKQSSMEESIFREREDLREKSRRIFEEIYESLNVEIRKSSANERHPELYRWRSKNPTPNGECPEILRHVRHVKRLDVSEPCHVYFLLRKGEVVYVGQTSAPWPARILQHLKEGAKQFDDVWYLEVDRSSLGIIERRFIAEFSPFYNKC